MCPTPTTSCENLLAHGAEPVVEDDARERLDAVLGFGPRANMPARTAPAPALAPAGRSMLTPMNEMLFSIFWTTGKIAFAAFAPLAIAGAAFPLNLEEG